MGATIIMIVRHAEKPGTYNGQDYSGVDPLATVCGKKGGKDLVTLGWQRAGALVTLFAPPWGPKPSLATPRTLFAADPAGDGDSDPSQRPFETLSGIAAALGSAIAPMPIDTRFGKEHFDKMVKAALASEGPVLISWQHELIPAMGQSILTQTATPAGSIPIPTTWPGTRYDLVWVFERPSGSGPITGFSIFAQMLLAGDAPAPPVNGD